MHIVLAVLGALAAAFWAFTHFMDAAQRGKTAVGEVKGVIRSGKWSRRVDKRLIENLSDPREAAAIMFVQIAAYDGAVTDRQREQITDDMARLFQADKETAEGLFAFARMAIGEVNDAGNSVRKIMRSVKEICSPEEKAAMIDILERTAEIESPPTDI